MSVPGWVKVGAKCVCIKRGAWTNGLNPGEVDPVYGDILTIRDVTHGRHGLVFLRFNEIMNPVCRWDRFAGEPSEARYLVDNFRPIVTLEDDIKAHFSQHLHAPQKIAERAS